MATNYFKVTFLSEGTIRLRPKLFPFDYRSEGTAYSQARAAIDDAGVPTQLAVYAPSLIHPEVEVIGFTHEAKGSGLPDGWSVPGVRP